MTDNKKNYRIFISAAEPSADSHCAGLIAALQNRGVDIEFVGLGGEKMASAGCQLLQRTAGKAAMIYKAFSRIPHFYRLIRKIRHFLKTQRPDLVIVCDSPAFNFHVAKAAKKAQIKTLFYVAPQLWAWGAWRLRKLKRCCDKLACILPFEEDWFKQRGVDAVFVGNPLLDGINTDLSNYRKSYVDFKPETAKIAIMPGSRNAEIDSLWLPMQQTALMIKQKYHDAQFTAVAVDSQRKDILKASQINGFECRYAIGNVTETALEADFSMVASGSATLQIAAVGCPMVIMYQSSKVLWHLIGSWLLKTKHLSLVNILAQRELVPEFMPYFPSIDPIAQTCLQLLSDKAKLSRLSTELTQMAQPLAAKKPQQRMANIVIDMLP
ncbi:lipid-A-disaccharide synthase [Planctomycetota bacterium]